MRVDLGAARYYRTHLHDNEVVIQCSRCAKCNKISRIDEAGIRANWGQGVREALI